MRCARGIKRRAAVVLVTAAACTGPTGAPGAGADSGAERRGGGEADTTSWPVVRLLDGRASETLRRTYHEAAGGRPTPTELRREGEWIDSVSAPLRAFWSQRGDVVVRRLTDALGQRWTETSVNVHFVRQPLGVVGFSLPLVLDLSAFERVPSDRAEFYRRLLLWALVHELVHRLRDQPYLARGTVGEEAADPLADAVAGSAHDWDDLVVAIVLRDVLGEDAVRPLLFNRALQRTAGIHRLDRFAERFLPRWQPSAARPLAAWLADEPDLDTGFHDRAAERVLESALVGFAGVVPAERVRQAAERVRRERGVTPEQLAQLLSDWEGRHGAGRLGIFPYRDDSGAWDWR